MTFVKDKSKKIRSYLVSVSPCQLSVVSGGLHKDEGIEVGDGKLQDLVVPGHHGLLHRAVFGLLRREPDVKVLPYARVGWN